MTGTSLLVNLTGHEVVVDDGHGTTVTIPPAGPAARVGGSPGAPAPVATQHGTVPLLTVHLGPVSDLPGPVPGVLLVVSRAVAIAAADRTDLVVPHDQRRDPHGRVVSCRALARMERSP